MKIGTFPSENCTRGQARVAALTSFTMIGFASNSLLCRLALAGTNIDASTFATIRICSAAVSLWLIVKIKGVSVGDGGSWLSASALFVYAAGFSFAYVSLSAATGALLLFSTVQVTMISYGIWLGERPLKLQYVGLVLAFAGLVGLLLPGISAPPLGGSLLMIVAGISWGIYSLRGRFTGDPAAMTAGNFLRAVPIVFAMSMLTTHKAVLDAAGIWYAVISGAIATGITYVVWYSVLPSLKATSAATVQLSVPVIAALGGIILLGEPLTLRFILAAAATLGGISLTISGKQSAANCP